MAARIRIYVQQSIALAYPDMGDRWIGEDVPLDSSPERSGICAPVITMQNLVKDIPANSMRWCILRGGMFVGRNTAQDEIIQRLHAGQEVIPGDGRNFISPVHANDMASAIAEALEHAPNASVFNINADPVREGDYADTLAAAIGAGKPHRDLKRPNPSSFRCSNNSAKEPVTVFIRRGTKRHK